MDKPQNLYQRINSVMLEVQSVVKDAEVRFANVSYRAVSHDAVTQALHMPLAKAGIVLKVSELGHHIATTEKITEYQGKQTVKNEYRADVTIEISLINADSPDERSSSTFSAYAFDSGDKALGKAVSMAVKNGLLKLFMLESLDHEEDRPTEGAVYTQKHKLVSKPLPPKISVTPDPLPGSKPIVADMHKQIKVGSPASAVRANQIYSMIKAAGWSEEDLKNVLKFTFNAKSGYVTELYESQYQQLTKLLKEGKTVAQARAAHVEVLP